MSKLVEVNVTPYGVNLKGLDELEKMLNDGAKIISEFAWRGGKKFVLSVSE
jgi:hypothetical protein